MLLRHSRQAHPENESQCHDTNTQELEAASRDESLLPSAFVFSPEQTQHQGVGRIDLAIDAGVTNSLESTFGRDDVVAGPSDLSSQLTLLPDDRKFSWWDSHDILNTFLPTELFNTDYSLANFDEQGVYQAENANFEDVGGAVVGNVDLANQSEQLPIGETVFQPEKDFNNARDATDNSRASASIGQELNENIDANMILPWRISPACYEEIRSKMASVSEALPQGFSLPSRHPLSRYIEGYFRGFDGHLPCIHIHTLSLQSLKPELLLALAAAGALYKFEHDKGYELFRASRAIINKSLHQRAKNGRNGHVSPSPNASNNTFAGGTIHTMQALNILLAMASWGDDQLLPEAFEMAGQLATLVRQNGISESDSIPAEANWTEWAFREEKRRTLLVSYILFSLQSIAFNVPPMILNHEVALFLPNRMQLWQAGTASQWKQSRNAADDHEARFQGALGNLLNGKDIHQSYPTSAFSNYLLIHGLIQQIFFERQASSCLTSSGPALRGETLKTIEVPLRAWQRAWESTTESTLDPLSPKGPLAFNSTALLRIAYIRLNANLGPHRSLQSRDAGILARSVTGDCAKIIERSIHVDRAVLQCIHALGILVRAGVSFVARTHTQNWSIVHSLCNIECACLLNWWLRSIANCVQSDGIAALRDDERGLLGMVSSIVAETDLGQDIHLIECEHERIKQLAARTVRLWAEAFSGVHVFQMVQVVAQGLSIAAGILDECV